MKLRLRFEGALNDFLPVTKRYAAFEQLAGPTDSLKHVIESLHVPHTEIGHVVVNGGPGDLADRAGDGDDIEVFPHRTPIHFAQPPKFVVDGHLGRLAAYLRMLGFDIWYERLADDPRLAAVSKDEGRILLTRDLGLLKRRDVEQGYFVRGDRPHDQLSEVSRHKR